MIDKINGTKNYSKILRKEFLQNARGKPVKDNSLHLEVYILFNSKFES